jgi:hypothetical protein
MNSLRIEESPEASCQNFVISQTGWICENQCMKSSSSDRRKKARVPVKAGIRHSIYQSAGTPVSETNSSVDLSGSGISFETSREYRKGDLVLLEIRMGSDDLRLLVCVARVLKTKSLFLVGAELIEVEPGQKQKMLEHLDHLVRNRVVKKKAKVQSRKGKKATPQKKRSGLKNQALPAKKQG